MAAPCSRRLLKSSRCPSRIYDFYKTKSHRFCTTYNSKPVLPHQIFLDTHAVVTALESSGFSRSQSECVMSILAAMSAKETEILQHEYVSCTSQEKSVQQIMSSIDGLKKDMVILEKTEFTLLRNESDKLSAEVKQMKSQLRDEIQKVENKVTLDINLERARAKEQSALALQGVNECNQFIKTESANMMAKLEASKTDVLKYFAATILGCLTLSMGIFRVFKS